MFHALLDLDILVMEKVGAVIEELVVEEVFHYLVENCHQNHFRHLNLHHLQNFNIVNSGDCDFAVISTNTSPGHGTK